MGRNVIRMTGSLTTATVLGLDTTDPNANYQAWFHIARKVELSIFSSIFEFRDFLKSVKRLRSESLCEWQMWFQSKQSEWPFLWLWCWLQRNCLRNYSLRYQQGKIQKLLTWTWKISFTSKIFYLWTSNRAKHVNMAAYVWMKTCIPLKCIAIVLELVIMVIYVKSMIASIAMRIKRALISISWFPIMQLANAKGPVEHTECTSVKLRNGPYNMYGRYTLDRPRS